MTRAAAAPAEEGCTLAGGEHQPVGWVGSNTGAQSCNTCVCMSSGLACTRRGCQTQEPTRATCTLSEGTVVAHGWSGSGEGSNSCNSCFCQDGMLACTRMLCQTAQTQEPTRARCTLAGGETVEHGWRGSTGSNC